MDEMSVGGRGSCGPPWKRVLGTRLAEELGKPPVLPSFPLVLQLEGGAPLSSQGMSVRKGRWSGVGFGKCPPP